MHSAETIHHTTQISRNLEDTLKSPTQHLLHKTIVRKASNISINDLDTPPTPSAGIRVQIGHLLPRHANFHARIQIHQISSVPFVGGEFGVRWKFKDVQSLSSKQKKGLLGMVKARTKSNDKGKGRKVDTELLAGTGNHDPVHPPLISDTRTVASKLPAYGPSTDRSISLGSVETGAHTSSHVSSSNSSITTHPHPQLHWADSSSSSGIYNSENANASHLTMVPDSILLESSTSVPSTHRRGTTPFLKLKDHTVIWSHTLDTLLKFDIDRETYHIQPHPLKLVVMQRVIPDDPSGSPQNPRLGAVYLNLAEYIGKGSVERKYLLKESKTNAVLKVSKDVLFLSPPTEFILS